MNQANRDSANARKSDYQETGAECFSHSAPADESRVRRNLLGHVTTSPVCDAVTMKPEIRLLGARVVAWVVASATPWLNQTVAFRLANDALCVCSIAISKLFGDFDLRTTLVFISVDGHGRSKYNRIVRQFFVRPSRCVANAVAPNFQFRCDFTLQLLNASE